MAQKIVQYQAVLQLAQGAPQLYNLPLLHRQMIEVLGIKNATKLVPMANDQKPCDPVTENQNVLMMKPVKAFSYQDHEAHIQIHMAAMQDPKILQLLANNPLAPQLQSAMMAHVNEHIGFQYRINIEQQMGMSLPAQKMDDMNAEEDVDMTPEMEAQLSPMIAQAAQKLLAQSQMQAKQQQAQQQAQDPIIQMQMQELQLKTQEQQRKSQKDQQDFQIKQQQLQIEQERIQSQAKIAAGNIVAQSGMTQAKLKTQRLQKAGELGMQALMSQMQQGHEDKKQTKDHVDQHVMAGKQQKKETKE
jgi:hypothetical protein